MPREVDLQHLPRHTDSRYGGLLNESNITCYEHCRPEAEAAGGKWIEEEATRDGKIISAQTWLSHPDFYRLIFQNI